MNKMNPVAAGAINGILTQFSADIFVSLFANGSRIFFEDFILSGSSSYAAAVASGITHQLLEDHLDTYALNALLVVVYAYVFNVANYFENDEEIDFNAQEIIFDIGVAIILTYAFDSTANRNYNAFKLKRQGYNVNTHIDAGTSNVFFLLIVTNTYIAYKNIRNANISTNTIFSDLT